MVGTSLMGVLCVRTHAPRCGARGVGRLVSAVRPKRTGASPCVGKRGRRRRYVASQRTIVGAEALGGQGGNTTRIWSARVWAPFRFGRFSAGGMQMTCFVASI